MKAVRFSRFGCASDVAELVEVPEPTPPGPGEVMIEVEVAPINPSDLLHFEGRYAKPAALPAFAGAGVLGRVVRSVRLACCAPLPAAGGGPHRPRPSCREPADRAAHT